VVEIEVPNIARRAGRAVKTPRQLWKASVPRAFLFFYALIVLIGGLTALNPASKGEWQDALGLLVYALLAGLPIALGYALWYGPRDFVPQGQMPEVIREAEKALLPVLEAERMGLPLDYPLELHRKRARTAFICVLFLSVIAAVLWALPDFKEGNIEAAGRRLFFGLCFGGALAYLASIMYPDMFTPDPVPGSDGSEASQMIETDAVEEETSGSAEITSTEPSSEGDATATENIRLPPKVPGARTDISE
jgi:hypothetical protein